MTYNPVTGSLTRKEPEQIKINIFSYKNGECIEKKLSEIKDIFPFCDTDKICWINVAGLRRKEVQELCEHFEISQLTIDDILSVGQRAKMDELGNYIFCLLPMMYFNAELSRIDREQVSLILGKNVVLSFQDEPSRDVFDLVREKLRTDHSRLRNNKADLLYHALLDAIVDDYFMVMEKLGTEIENMEDTILRDPTSKTLAYLNHFRREVSLLRRALTPVRELVNGLLKTETGLIQKKTIQYFKDIYDHILQANETAESYRDLVMNLQGLYLNQVNLKMNEVMKVLAVVTALFAPLSLIAGIYGMNFSNMPELHSRYGYFITLGVMLILFCVMLYFFKKRGWF
jgi:magnesium transporter